MYSLLLVIIMLQTTFVEADVFLYILPILNRKVFDICVLFWEFHCSSNEILCESRKVSIQSRVTATEKSLHDKALRENVSDTFRYYGTSNSDRFIFFLVFDCVASCSTTNFYRYNSNEIEANLKISNHFIGCK